ncbi:methyltransferase family protein [[Eubacterium] cellulosolvens]
MKESILNLISAVTLIFVLLMTIIFSNQFNLGLLSTVFGIAIGIIGLIIWIVGKHALGKSFTTTIIPKGLVTTGIYSKIRHPLYLGTILFFLGVGLYSKSIVGLTLTMILIIPLVAYLANLEEKALIEKFGSEYLDYKKKTIF